MLTFSWFLSIIKTITRTLKENQYAASAMPESGIYQLKDSVICALPNLSPESRANHGRSRALIGKSGMHGCIQVMVVPRKQSPFVLIFMGMDGLFLIVVDISTATKFRFSKGEG